MGKVSIKLDTCYKNRIQYKKEIEVLMDTCFDKLTELYGYVHIHSGVFFGCYG